MATTIHQTKDWLRRMYDRGFCFPNSYVVFDCETTGTKTEHDYIVQLGHLVVEDRVPRDPYETVLDWIHSPAASQGDVRQRFIEIAHDLKCKDTYRFSYDKVAAEGYDPIEVLSIYFEFFKSHQAAGCSFATHNGVRFDTRIVSSHFKRFLGENFQFDNSKMIDTGLLEKGMQLNMMLHDGESLPSYYNRVESVYGKGVMWSLANYCVPTYKLAEKHNLNMHKSHTAGFDCHVTHLLLEEYRKIAGR